MEVYFNELCLINLPALEYQDILRLRDLYTKLKSNGIDICRISDKDYVSMILYVKSMKGSTSDIINFLYAFLQRPYESENVEERQDEYLAHSWLYAGSSCYGAALAVIMDSMTVSTGDSIQWDRATLSLLKDKVIVQARNLYGETTFSCHLQWLLDCQPVQLEYCQIIQTEKKIHLRDDHGKNILERFCKKLICSPYVCEVINSMPFNSQNRRFIREVKDNGIIEIVLPWTDKGLGVVVKTTGRNRRETEKIAEILKKEYGCL